MDELGYDSLWLAEHHFQHEGYECIPNIPLLAVHIANHTRRLKIGCGFNIMPTWHPLRLAEDYATADILTGGRLIFGVGRGYHTREVESFGNPMLDADANRELFEEQVEIMLKAFNQASFSHQGKYYTIPPACRTAATDEGDHAGAAAAAPARGDLAADRERQRAQPRLHGQARHQGRRLRHRRAVRRALAARLPGRRAPPRPGADARRGRDPRIPHVHRRHPGAGRRRARPYFEEHAKFMAPLGMLRYSEEHVKAVAARKPQSPTAATIENGVQNRTWLCGPAESSSAI